MDFQGIWPKTVRKFITGLGAMVLAACTAAGPPASAARDQAYLLARFDGAILDVPRPVRSDGAPVVTASGPTDLASAIQREAMTNNEVRGHIGLHGMAGHAGTSDALYFVSLRQSCALSTTPIRSLQGLMRQYGASQFRCLPSETIEPGQGLEWKANVRTMPIE